MSHPSTARGSTTSTPNSSRSAITTISSTSALSSGSRSSYEGESAWAAEEGEDEYSHEVVALLGGIKKPKKRIFPAADPENPSSVPEGDFDGDDPNAGKLKLSHKLAYGLPNFATSAMFLPTSIHINKFFADTLLVPPGTLALATAIARAFDTLLDPLFGWLSDNTNTRWGRRKPYIAVGVPFCALFYFLLFTPPASLTPNEASVWFGCFFALYLLFPITLPHHALGPEMTSDYKERASLYAYHETFYLLGVIFAAAAPGVLAQYIPDTREIFFIMSLTVAFLLLITFAILLYVIEEPTQVVHTGNPLVPGLRRAWRNHPFRILCYVSIIGSVAHHITALMFPFYISYVLHPVNDAIWLSAILLCYFGSSAISIPLWCYLAKKYDKKYVWLTGWGLHLPTTLAMFFLTEGASWSLLMLIALVGLSFGGSSYLYKSIQADVIDYDELRTTRRREGQYITFWALVPKLVSIPAASIPLIVLEQAGYVPNAHPQTHEVQMTIRIMTTIMPCFLSGLALLAASRYPISREKNTQIFQLIDRRRRAIRNGTPLPREFDPVSGGELAQVHGGLLVLSSEFCWYLDNFSVSELKLVLKRGQKALIWSVSWSIYLFSAFVVLSSILIWLGGTTVKVIAVMLASFSLAIIIFHGLRLHAAYQFDAEKIRTFRKGQEEYFRVLGE